MGLMGQIAHVGLMGRMGLMNSGTLPARGVVRVAVPSDSSRFQGHAVHFAIFSSRRTLTYEDGFSIGAGLVSGGRLNRQSLVTINRAPR